MRYYEVNPRSNDVIRTNLANMDSVLKEVSTTYRILLELLRRHEQSARIPELNDYRLHLERLVAQAARQSEQVARDTARFAAILAELDTEIAKSQAANSVTVG
jgi:hypothetical protein